MKEKKKLYDRNLGFTARALGSFKVLKKKIDVIKCLFKNKAGRQWGKLILQDLKKYSFPG